MVRRCCPSERRIGRPRIPLHGRTGHRPQAGGCTGREPLPVQPVAAVSDALPRGAGFLHWRVGCKPSSLDQTTRVLRRRPLPRLRGPAALAACCCPLRVSPSGEPVAQERSSEFLPVAPGRQHRASWRTLAPRRPSRFPSVVDVRARRRCRVRPLAWAHCPPSTRRRVRVPATLTRYPGGPAPDAVVGDVCLHHRRLRFRESALHRIARVLRDAALRAFRPLPLSHHAAVPFGFRRQVGWVTQKPQSSELLPAARGIDNRVKRRT